jgi:hypothetical protein
MRVRCGGGPLAPCIPEGGTDDVIDDVFSGARAEGPTDGTVEGGLSTAPSYSAAGPIALAPRAIGLTLVLPQGDWNALEPGAVEDDMRTRMTAPASPVTLVIYGWHDSEPGTLSWVFPSLSSALSAVEAMRNAMSWLIVRGRRAFDVDLDIDLDALRRAGTVLVERTA